jgi:hypothetical protein
LLVSSIRQAETWYRDAKIFSHKKPIKEQNARLNLLFKLSKRLEQLMSLDEVRDSLHFYTDPELPELLQEQLLELQTAVECALLLYGPDDRGSKAAQPI